MQLFGRNITTKLKWSSLRPAVPTASVQEAQHPLPAKPSSTTYSCRELTLERFEQAYIENRLEALALPGTNPTQEALQMAWADIQAEYCDLTGDDSFKEMMRLRSLNTVLMLKIEHVQLLVHYLSHRYEQVYIDALKAYGYNEGDKYRFDYNDPQSYIRDLHRVSGSLARDEQRIEENSEEINSYIESKKSSRINTGYFDDILVEIERGLQLHFPLDKAIITIGKYATYLDKLRKQKPAKPAK